MAGIGKTSYPPKVFDCASIPGQVFLVTGALGQCLLHVAGAPRYPLARLVPRSGDVAEPERLARPTGLDEPALTALAAVESRDERVDDAVDGEQRHPDRRQGLTRLRGDDVGVGEPGADRVD